MYLFYRRKHMSVLCVYLSVGHIHGLPQTRNIVKRFLPRDAMHGSVLAVVRCMYVCLSVCRTHVGLLYPNS